MLPRLGVLVIAGFIGSPAMNFLQGRLEAIEAGMARVTLGLGPVLEIPVEQSAGVGAEVIVGIRPEHLRVGGHNAANFVSGEAAMLEMHGSDTFIHWRSGGESIIIRQDGRCRLRRGDSVSVRIDPMLCHLFAQSGRRISVAHQQIGAAA